MLSKASKLSSVDLLLASFLFCPHGRRVKRLLVSVFFDPDFFQDGSKGTEFGEAELEKVQADKGGKKKPVNTVKKRACFNAQRKAEENKKSCNNMYPICDYHRFTLGVDSHEGL